MIKKLLACFILSMCATTCTFAQDEEPPEEQTLFEKLKERRLARRDARVNKDGCKPGRERTPDLLRIADKKNLESDSELIVIAAKAKMDADLAPQKIKALRYLATLGCGCNSDVEKAVLAGLNDCTPEVRLEAVRLVVAIASEKDICELSKKKRFERKKMLCGKCKGKGCQGCRLKGHVEVNMPVQSGADCNSCNTCSGGMEMGSEMCGCDACVEAMESCCVCGTCCSEKIQDKLRKMVYQQDGNGCFLEPDPAIRKLAQEALCLCPCGDPMTSGGTSGPQTFDDPDPELPQTPAPRSPLKPVKQGQVEIESGGVQGEAGGNNSAMNYRNLGGNVSYPSAAQGSNQSNAGYVFSQADRANMLLGTVTSTGNGELNIKFEDAFLLPAGANLYVSGNGGEKLATVKSSKVGSVELQITQSSGRAFRTGQQIWIGVMGPNQ